MLPYSQKVGIPIHFTYEYYGSPHTETWYILSATQRYVILAECSFISTWTNVGSIVWVRPKISLTKAEMSEIADVYQQSVGWTFPDQFCKVQHVQIQIIITGKLCFFYVVCI